MNTKKKELAKRRKALTSRDVATSKRLELRSWDPKKVKGIVVCYHCNKAHCFFVWEINAEYEDAIKLWQQKMEAIDFRYSCGDLVFEDDHPVSKVLAQRQALSCESQIEKAYYNLEERALKLLDICIHCGEGGDSDFLLGRAELEAKGKTEGKQCYPICTMCLGKGKAIVKYPKKKTNQTKKRKEEVAKKLR